MVTSGSPYVSRSGNRQFLAMVTFGSHVGNHQFQPFLSGVYAGVIFFRTSAAPFLCHGHTHTPSCWAFRQHCEEAAVLGPHVGRPKSATDTSTTIGQGIPGGQQASTAAAVSSKELPLESIWSVKLAQPRSWHVKQSHKQGVAYFMFGIDLGSLGRPT